MPEFGLHVNWTLVDYVTIEARTKEEAIQKVKAGGHPKNGEYLSDSFTVESCEKLKGSKQ